MTAEVVIMNSIGVAMAADSAVTIGTDAHKIFTSTDKLFQLSANEPVGVMIYGNTQLLGVPWETIIKRYRAGVGLRRLRTVRAYAESFLAYLARSEMFPRRAQDVELAMLIHQFLAHLREDLLAPALDKAGASQPLRAPDIDRIMRDTLDKFRMDTLKDAERIRGFGAAVVRRIRTRHRPTAMAAFRDIFGKLPLNPGTRSAVINTALDLLSQEAFGPANSGLVFAGFGTEEYLPRAFTYHLEGFADGKLRVGRMDVSKIEQYGLTASVVPFAQHEVVQTFMDGINSNLKARFAEQVELAIDQIGKALVSATKAKSQAIAAEMEQVLKSGVPRVVEALDQKWSEFCRNHWEPVTQIVATLPKDELAAMAEALVNLTKLKRRITPQKETVAGPVDVAVITRGDGFVWIKRKHYFDPALNPRVMANLAR